MLIRQLRADRARVRQQHIATESSAKLLRGGNAIRRGKRCREQLSLVGNGIRSEEAFGSLVVCGM